MRPILFFVAAFLALFGPFSEGNDADPRVSLDTSLVDTSLVDTSLVDTSLVDTSLVDTDQ